MTRSVEIDPCGLLRNCVALLSGKGFNEFSFSLTTPSISLSVGFRFNPYLEEGLFNSNLAVCDRAI